MKPGLARAVPMGILGFLGGAGLVLILRALQGVDPVWDPEIGFIMAAFTTAFAFVWGMGAFNPQVNQHPHEPEVDEETGLAIVPMETALHHEEDIEVLDTPVNTLGYSIWQVSFWSIVTLVVLFGFATIPFGFYLRTASEAEASVTDVGIGGTINLPFGGAEMEISQMTQFVGFVGFTLVSLLLISGAIGFGFWALTSGVTRARESAGVEFGSVTVEPASGMNRLVSIGVFLVVLVIVYIVFYYVAIGLVLPNPDWLRVILSAVNAVVITMLLVTPTPFLRAVGKGAAWLAKVLRGVPDAVQ